MPIKKEEEIIKDFSSSFSFSFLSLFPNFNSPQSKIKRKSCLYIVSAHSIVNRHKNKSEEIFYFFFGYACYLLFC